MKGLAIRRNKAGLTQVEAASKLGTDRSTIAKWETGAACPRAELIPAIAKLYGCTIDDLFYEEKSERACAFEGKAG